ncbi:MAG: hypothetical protein HZB85_02280 [Deltaproteobacteria bacterium]|nr:hypothetical protein [Deltaproteobacteria bacterium]
MADTNNHDKTDEPIDVAKKSWWTLTFDETTSFSILGYVIGNRHDKDGPKKTDLILK